MIYLYCTGGILEGNIYPLKDGSTIGRSTKNSIIIKDSFVSKEHCYFYNHYNDFYIVDNNSHNGLFVNSIRFKLKRLYQGDRLKIGKNYFVFYEGEGDILNRKYELLNTQDKNEVKDILMKRAEFKEGYLQIFYRIISPYLQEKDRDKFWKNLKNIIYKFNIENFLFGEIENGKIKKLDVLTSYYDKLPELTQETIRLIMEDKIVTLKRSVKSISLWEYLILYPFKRGNEYYIWFLGRFSPEELTDEDLNQIYFTGLILSFLK